MLITILAFIAILSVLILIHEFGHYITAKKLGIKVEEFGFGFPPRVYGKKVGETVYSFNLLPIGGFVKLYGEDEAGAGKIKKTESVTKNVKRAFFARPIWQRMLIVTAGVIMNFFLAVTIISYLFATQGVVVPTDHITITEILPESPAEEAGIVTGDKVTAINGREISGAEEFINLTQQNLDEEVTLKVERDSEILTLTLIPRSEYPEGQGPIGIGISDSEVKKYSIIEAPFYGTLEAVKFTGLIVVGLTDMVSGLLFEGKTPEGVAGPIGVAQLTGHAVQFGFNATLWFTALLSLNLAVLNILPIPALDGGRLFFILIELVTRKRVSQKYETYAHVAGLVLLLTLMAVVTVVDVGRIFSGQSLIPEL